MKPKLQLAALLTRVAVWNGVVLNGLLGLLALAALHWGLLERGVVSTGVSAALLWLFRGRQGDDSWRPMLHALDVFEAHLPVYQTIFFDLHDKFQYPLTSLLPMYLLRQAHWSDAGILKLMNVLTWIAFWLTIAISVRILILAARRHGLAEEVSGRRLYAVTIAATLCGLCFYPLLKNYVLGQAQTFISLMFACSLYLWMERHYKWSGLLVGFMCLIKPQYALFLIWFALRKKLGGLIAAAAVMVSGFSAASLVFGWKEQIAYVRVLRYISQHGESYWPNESMNGLLNRLLFHGSNLHWTAASFAPYSPFVYATTAITSASLVALALWFPFDHAHRSDVLDYCVLGLTATVASPVAWEHHYGILVPIFAYLAGSLAGTRNRTLLCAAFVLTSNAWSPMNVFAGVPVLNVLQSLRFFGALALLVYLYRNAKQQPLQESPLPAGYPVLVN